jgi:ABC-2 type transport system permease protein
MAIKQNLELFKEYIKVNVSMALEYRFSFIVQSVTMLLNDLVWILFWWIFFSKFQIINGWTMQHMIMLYALLTFSYGVGSVFFGNKNYISSIISEGRLDFYLNLPKNILFHTLISRSNWFGLGDIIFGLTLAGIVLSIKQWPLFLLLSIISATILIAFAVLTGSLAFFFGEASETARSLNMGITTLSSYPYNIFGGTVKVIMLTVLPAGFITGIPIELLYNFNWTWLLATLGFAILFLTISVLVFYKGLKRYESGSMITTRI